MADSDAVEVLLVFEVALSPFAALADRLEHFGFVPTSFLALAKLQLDLVLHAVTGRVTGPNQFR